MLDQFSKTYCIYHPGQSITNFCKEKSCLMPLCPTCVCSHIELHIKEGKAIPQFDNIQDSLAICYKEVKGHFEKLDESRLRLNSIQRNVHEQKKELSDMIYSAKVQVRELVDQAFNELEKELQGAVYKQDQALKLHLPEYINEMQRKILDASSKLRQTLTDLKNQSCLSALITYQHEGRKETQKMQQEINKHLRSNEEYYPITHINNEAISRIKQSIQQVVNLRFNFPPISGKSQIVDRQNNLITPGIESAGGSKLLSPGIHSPRTTLTKIGNATLTSPGRMSMNQRSSISPGRFPSKSMVTSPIVGRRSTDGLSVLSQLNH